MTPTSTEFRRHPQASAMALPRLGPRRARVLAASALAVVLLASGCGSGGDGDKDGGFSNDGIPEGGMFGQQETPDAVDGGTLRIGEFYPVTSLDPVASIAHGCCGGNELNAIFDTLLRFDPKTQEFVPQLAESIEGNSDHTAFTLRLRKGTTFSDGSQLDSSAVVFSMKRFIALKSRFAPLVDNIASYETPNPLTVVFRLKTSWPQFPAVLVDAPGMVVSPAAVKAQGDEQFAKTPVGAGPFTVDTFVAGEQMKLSANENYVNGRPHLDGLVFQYLAGDDPKVDALESGQLDAAFLRDAVALDRARAAGYPGFVNLQGIGKQLSLNSGVGTKDDRPTFDPRVRRAIALAIDPAVINERAYEGTGFPTKDYLPETSPYRGESSTLDYDATEAKKLVAEAKKDLAWDGGLNFVCDSAPTSRAAALAVNGMLDAVGFKTDLEIIGDTSVLTQRTNVQGDYDVACAGFNLDGYFPYIALKLRFSSDSVQNTTGYSSPELDALIDTLQSASEKEDLTAALDQIQARMDEDVPVVPVSSWPEAMVWSHAVHGVEPSGYSTVLFDKAFVTK